MAASSSASTLWDVARCAVEPIGTPPLLETVVEEYQILSDEEVYKPESWFRHFYCGQVYLQ